MLIECDIESRPRLTGSSGSALVSLLERVLAALLLLLGLGANGVFIEVQAQKRPELQIMKVHRVTVLDV